MIVSSGVTSATFRVYLIAIYTDPEAEEQKEMDYLVVKLIVQYSSLILTMTIIDKYTFKKVINF